MIQYTYTPIKYDEAYVRKLKLERLMWKADSQAWYYTDLGFSSKASRWHNLYEACRKELEK